MGMTPEQKRARDVEYNRRYRAVNRERYQALSRASYLRNAEKRKARARQRRAEHHEAVRAADARWRAKNKERIKEIRKRYNERHKEKIKARQAAQRNSDSYRERRRKHYSENRDRILLQKASRRYGVPPSEISLLHAKQGGSCAGCRRAFKKTPHIDHDHSTGVVRGLLCFRCNNALGCANDSPQILRALADYVERTSRRSQAA